MKVHHPGRSAEIELYGPAWWLGRVFTCACECRFEIEDGDAISVYEDVTDPAVQVLWIRCPGCGLGLRFRSDDPVEGEDSSLSEEAP